MKLQQIINEKLLKEQEERSKRVRSGLWSPSSFGRCYRYQVWNRRNEPPTNLPDERALRIFRVGKLFHDFIEKELPIHQKEVMVEKDDVLGYADIVSEDTVIDIKSQHSRAFHYMYKKTYDIAKEKYSNWLQVAWYGWVLEKKMCGLIMISRDDLTINEYYIPTEKWVGEVQKELSVLRSFWGKSELPPPNPRAFGGKENRYCPYKDKCGGDCK